MPHLGGPVDDATLELIVKPYLERIYELRGDDPQNINQTELQLLMLEARILEQVSWKILRSWTSNRQSRCSVGKQPPVMELPC